MSRSVRAIKTTAQMLASLAAWLVDRSACALKSRFGESRRGELLAVPSLETADVAEVARAMQRRRPAILRNGVQATARFDESSLETFAREVEPVEVCVAPEDGTFSYGSEINVRMSPRELVERVFGGRPTSARLYLRASSREIFGFDLEERIGPYEIYKESTTVFISQAGCVTRLHHDANHGFLMQLKGTKKVVLFPPEEAYNLYESPIRFARTNRFADLPEDDCTRADRARFPRIDRATRFEALLEPGRTLYIPPFWWHEVTSVEPSISLVMAYQLAAGEFNSARRFARRLELFMSRLGLVRRPAPQRFLSSELEGHRPHCGAEYPGGSAGTHQESGVYDLDPKAPAPPLPDSTE